MSSRAEPLDHAAVNQAIDALAISPVAPRVARRAQLAVCAAATSPADAAELLAALGLLTPIAADGSAAAAAGERVDKAGS